MLSGLRAQQTITLKKPLTGLFNQLAADSAVTVIDSLYYDPQLVAKADTPYQIKNIITLHINEEAGIYLGQQFTAAVQLRIAYPLPDGTEESYDKTLTVNFNQAGKYTARQSFVFSGAHKVTVTVVQVTITGGDAHVLKSLVLENEMNIRPQYKFSRDGNAIHTVQFASPAPGADELQVSWANVTGADEYDLEWAYIDASALAANRYGNGTAIDPSLVFRNNASRISTTGLFYAIPLLYDNDGSLFFRVRAVQVKGDGARYESKWSTDYLPAGMGRFDFAGHENNLNWQASTSFAEEGKRKAVVQYFDGSLRNRQTVTKDNSVNKTVVSETMYDYQGRPVIQVMPAPTLSSIISYSRNFNKGLNGAEYTKDLYDSLPDPSAFCDAKAPAMDSSGGAAQYYSAANPEIGVGNNILLPASGGFAFAETEYTQDNTGRINRQGGAGAAFRLGSGHETKYYYAATPDQQELDALFGTEVGDRTHYFKNMVRDANGQFSVSYVDMHGRTIATALAGSPPDSIRLQKLDSYQEEQVTENLAEPGSTVIKDLVMENRKSLLVEMPGTHEFSYSLSPLSLQQEGCTGNAICYSCLYDLQITITDDCNNQKLNGKPFDTTIHNFRLDSIRANCNQPAAGFSVQFALQLQPGNYEITKKLSISRDALQYYRDSIFLVNNTCKTFDQVVAEQRSALLARSGDCTPTCAGCLADIGSWEQFRDQYLTQAGIPLPDSAAHLTNAWQAYQQAMADCNALCGKNSDQDDQTKAFVLDMTAPSGQYANPDSAASIYSIFYFKGEEDKYISAYEDPSISYLDEFGKRDSVYDETTGAYVLPQQLGARQFVAAFKPSWANALLKFHPEYCKLKAYQKHQASLAWDRQFEAADTYQEALAKGYLNPTGNTTQLPFSRYTAVAANTDPLALEKPAYRQQLEASLSNFGKFNNNVYSMWSMASMMVRCNQADQPCILSYQPDNKAFSTSWCTGDLDMAWRSFRQSYLGIKNNLYATTAGDGCPASAVSPKTLQDSGYFVHFMTALDALNNNGLSVATSGNASLISGTVNASLTDYYAQNCTAYVQQWLKQLSPCVAYSPEDLNNILLPRLLQVCKDGADASHPYGASTVKPGGSYAYTSFEQVIDEYNRQHNIPADIRCNADVITAPLPYDRQTAYGNQAVYSKPENCQCTLLNNLFSDYRRTTGYSSFSAYLKTARQIDMSDADLAQLLNLCNTASDCKYLPQPIVLPPALQCNTSKGCATCVEVDSLYRAFTQRFPGMTPAMPENDTAQQAVNDLFAGFMNHRLGFAKDASAYLQFRDSCTRSGYTDTVTCTAQPVTVANTYTSPGGGTEFMNSILRTADQGYVMAGSTTGADAGESGRSSGTPKTDAYILKTDSSGNVLWARKYGGAEDDVFNAIKATSDGGFIALGTTKSYHNRSKGEIFVVKLNAAGEVAWSRAIGFATPYGEVGRDVLPLSNGGFAISGIYNLNPAGGSSDWVLGALSSTGQVNWLKHLGNPDSDEGGFLEENNDTLVVATFSYFPGNAASAYYFSTRYDGILLKINKNTGAVVNMTIYDINNRTNWFGTIKKTARGYLVNALNTDDFGAGGANAAVLEVDYQGNAIRATQVSHLPGDKLPGATLVYLNNDGTYTMAQSDIASPQDVYFSKINTGNQVISSNQVKLPGDQLITYLAPDRRNGYAATGISSAHAWLLQVDSAGKTGCYDSAVTITASASAVYVTKGLNPYIDEVMADTAFAVPVTAVDIHPLLNQLQCTGKDSTCYTSYSGPLLCGNNVAVFAPPVTVPVNACTDSTFFIASTSQELYRVYQDSVKGYFDSAYIGRCLQGYAQELFTVKRTRSEYHYTLYYYDQAGNLVKTIPPAGVRVNRDPAWLAQVRTARSNGQSLVPAHVLPTQYRYNTLNQVMLQQSPDGGDSRFWYDRLGRLNTSQNARQAVAGQYSYTLYDYLGRITQVGQLASGTAMTDAVSRNNASWQQWFTTAAGSLEQVTQTVYDLAYDPLQPLLQAANLRNRVAWTALYNQAADLSTGNHASASFYSYDIHGNVDTLVLDYKQGVMGAANRFKKLVYQYDLVSGKVNSVAYQPGEPDGFYHRYQYDAENRLTQVETSLDSLYWETEAWYAYYRHGPMSRQLLGQQQVQGLDYAYTLQGWLKSINPFGVNPGGDGQPGSNVAVDAHQLQLNYHTKDYAGIGTGSLQPGTLEQLGSEYRPLYNGNINSLSVNISRLASPLLYNYQYDQLNRLRAMDAWKGDSASFTGLQKEEDYHEGIVYDGNGNIGSYQRNGSQLGGLSMDNLTYQYQPGTNRLDHINDAVPASTYAADLDDQPPGNYGYDATGNLVSDQQAGISSIRWTVYGKIQSISKTDGTQLRYSYDASGNRLSKGVTSGGATQTTWYVRDAQGNVLSVYTSGTDTVNSGHLTQSELHLYGSSRLGLIRSSTDVTELPPAAGDYLTGLGNAHTLNFVRGNKVFELSNHLGNVLSTVSDKKTAVSLNDSVVSHYLPDVVSAHDYYPFGMPMPGRAYNAGNGYRYGFNNKENDNEINGVGRYQDYGMREYDPAVGRFISVDPLTSKYPELTPYQFASNSSIANIDLDGLERSFYLLSWQDQKRPKLVSVLELDAKVTTIFGTVHNLNLDDKSFVYGQDKHWHEIPNQWRSKSLSQAGEKDAVDKMINGWPVADKDYSAARLGLDLQKAGEAAGAGVMVGDGLRSITTGIIKGAKYMSGTFKIGQKTLAKVSKHLEQFGVKAENTVMLDRMQKIAKGEMKATEIDINFAKHELREAELMKGGAKYADAHEAVLKEQGMYHRGYQEKLYTEEAIKAGDAQMLKEASGK